MLGWSLLEATRILEDVALVRPGPRGKRKRQLPDGYLLGLTVRSVPHNTSVDDATQLLYAPFM
jgi:hypothetical protein